MTSNSPSDEAQYPKESSVDRGTIDKARLGDRAAQRLIYEQCHRQIYRLMVRMVGIDEAADLTQQVFLHVLGRLDRFAGHAKFETWLYRVAVNEALQHLRKEKRRRWQPLLVDPVGPNVSLAEGRECQELLERAMEQIDPDLRAVFLLREVEGLSYAQLAETLGVAEGTVASRLSRARQTLRERLQELGWEP